MKLILLTPLLLILLSRSLIAVDDNPPVPVHVIHDGDDVGGEAVIFKIKELIRKSATFKISDKAEGALILNMQTMNYKTEYSYMTIYSISWEGSTPGPFRIKYDGMMGYFGQDRTSAAAESILANTARVSEQVMELAKLWNQ